MRNGQTSKNRNLRALEAKAFAVDAAEKIGVSRATVERQIQTAKNLTPEVKEIIKGSKISKTDALKLSRLTPDQQKEAAVQLISGDIRSVDEYRPIPAKPTSPEQPEPQVSGIRYSTIKDSVDDLKNPDKDRRRTPDTLLMTFSFFLQRLCQGVANYSTPEHEVVFPALTREQLGQLRVEIQSVHTALDGLFYKMERNVNTNMKL